MGLFGKVKHYFGRLTEKIIFQFRDQLSSVTVSGKKLSLDDLISESTVYSCALVLAQDISAAPLNLYQRSPNGDRNKAIEHPLNDLVRWQPNDEMTSLEMREAMMFHLLFRGNSYAHVVRDSKGKMVELYPLDSRKTRPMRAPDDNRLLYVYRFAGVKEVMLERNEVLHIRGFSSDGINGLSPLTFAKNAVGLSLDAEKHGSHFLKNGARPSGVLKHPQVLGDTAYNRLKQEWDKKHSGNDNVGSTVILEEGMDYMPISMTNEDAQYLELRKYQRSTLAGLFRVPAHLINDLERATFSNIEQMNIAYLTQALTPWVERIEQRYNITLLTRQERKKYYFKHNMSHILRGDIKSRFEAYAKAINNGIFSPNEARAKEEMNKYEGGDIHIVNGSFMSVERIGEIRKNEDNSA